MFTQVKYALLDIKNSKRITLVFFLQMVVVFLLINSSIIDIIRVTNGLNRLERMKDAQAFVSRDATSIVRLNALIADMDNSIRQMRELYSYIKNNNRIVSFSTWSYATRETIDGHPIMQATANRMFFDIFDIRVINGRMFSEEDFASDAKPIPILVGYNLRNRFRLGEIYMEDNLDDLTSEKVSYKVIGILEHNASFPSLIDIGREINLNYTYFEPINLKLLNDFGSLDMAINSTVVFTHDESEVRSIEKKSSRLGLFDIQYVPIQKQVDEFLMIFEKIMIYQMFLASIIILFAATSMALNLTAMISKKMREFSIHIICGGRINSIIQRLLWRILIILFASLVPTALFLGIVLPALIPGVHFCGLSLAYTILLACLISLLIMIVPCLKMRMFSIAQLLRGSE